MKQTKTRWFSAVDEPPVRVGWYEFYDSLWGSTFMARWDGNTFIMPQGYSPQLYARDRWRGLTEEAK